MKTTLNKILEQIHQFEAGDLPAKNWDISSLMTKLSSTFRAQLKLIKAPEYVSSDALVIYFSPDARALPSNAVPQTGNALYAAFIRLSWLFPYTTICWQSTRDGRHWIALRPDELPPEIKKVSDRLASFLDEHGFIVIAGPLLDVEVPGQRSELDDSPASVYQVLFSEL
jgi:hypothetical protein